ncbi:MAG: glycerophosphodiester phosphodiesterase family protein [Xanthobacteraceae bacterium]|jgi:glycerophosphoryl diester phosphodiesterase|uniref:glycerophosphodiester phosphodiesterase family protein n=1 Tax=Pseudolabrys sp. TaxID=1960880 RepID=UPI003D0EE735
MSRLDWLSARPIAHRGLHDAAQGAIENTASAFRAAIEGGYAIETDLQISADGEAMVHHDDTLGRLTEGHAPLASLTAAQIKAAPFKATSDRVMTLGELCDLIAGRTPLVIELKSRFDGDRRVAERAAGVLAGYDGPAALMSFDPLLIETVRMVAPARPRGIVAEHRYSHHEWDRLTAGQKRRLAWLLHAPLTRPQFIAFGVRDLPAVAPLVGRFLFGLPLLTWTVRTPQDRATAARWTDQMIFEGFRP